MARVLTCKCGDCKHWEIICPEQEKSVIWSILDAITPHHGVHSAIKCMTCGAEYPTRIAVHPHEDLHEVELDAPVSENPFRQATYCHHCDDWAVGTHPEHK